MRLKLNVGTQRASNKDTKGVKLTVPTYATGTFGPLDVNKQIGLQEGERFIEQITWSVAPVSVNQENNRC